MTDKAISPLRQRMIEDMTSRHFAEKVQKDSIRYVKNFTAFLGRHERGPSSVSIAYHEQARWRLGFVEERQRIVAAKAANGDVPRHRIFQVTAPDGRTLRHRAHGQAQLRSELKSGYEITGEVFGFDGEGKGGLVASVDPAVPTVLDAILQAHGPELMLWLEQQGVQVRKGEA